VPASRHEVELALDARATLGECPLWHEQRKKLYWVDILEKEIHEFDPSSGKDRTYYVGHFVGCVGIRKKGGLILGLHHALAHFDFRTKSVRPICRPGGLRRANRFNDGKCDPAGRFWAGTMDLGARPGRGSLYVLNSQLRVRCVLNGVTISNGMAWSLDARTLYYIDSASQDIWAFDYDRRTGNIYNRRIAFRIPKRLGLPDGMTIDVEGMLWVALWGGGRVARWNPQTGNLLETIRLPVSLVTSCSFGGPGLSVLFITSARTSLNRTGLAREPLAGGLFRVEPGPIGTANHQFAG
jgi:sugar lactone lactonase YvrE